MDSPGRRRRARRTRRPPLLCTALAAVVAVGGTAAGTVYVKERAHAGAGAVPSSATPRVRAGAGEEASVESLAQPSVDRDALLAEAMASVSVEDGAEVSVAVLDVESGADASYGSRTFDTASIVKADILAALLLQAQDAGRDLTAPERSRATAMIENSDNASASALWEAIGRADGLGTANKRFGLTETEGGDGALWGLTRTTAADQLTLLRVLFGKDTEGKGGSVLDAGSRAFVRRLMSSVAAGQDWGVSAAADGTGWALKNGWLPRSTTGLWDVNSIGRVTAGGRDYLVAVLSDGGTTKAEGVSLVESAARAAVSALREADAD
ncbi:serine hydrolase [Streptomyces sp. NPDC008313]|uniref:serine hydrolase n=1 Tax=Streptomyces sp. NPDC008313 TaxID=3364826 RepID=UPI0036E7D164